VDNKTYGDFSVASVGSGGVVNYIFDQRLSGQLPTHEQMRYGVQLGWSLSRWKIEESKRDPQPDKIKSFRQEVFSLLDLKNVTVKSPSSGQVIDDVLQIFGTSDNTIRVFILFGMAGYQIYVATAFKEIATDIKAKLVSAARKAFDEIELSVIPEKEILFNRLTTKEFSNVSQLIDLFDVFQKDYPVRWA
jgi:hypothetical protein